MKAKGQSAFGYLRISKDPQRTSISPDRQRHEIAASAAAKGFTIVEWFEDRDISAFKRVHRPAFEAMLGRLDEADAIFVWELSRAARRMAVSMSLLDLLEEKGKRLVSVTQGDTGEGQRFVFDVLCAADANESRRLAERVKSAKAHLIRSGRFPFRARAFGWERQGDAVVQVPEEVERIRWMVERYLSGMGPMAIARELNDLGVPTIWGGEWRTGTVLAVLRSPRLGGQVEVKGERLPIELEPVLDAGTLRVLSAEIRRRQRTNVRSPRTDAELSGLLICDECKRRMYPMTFHARNKLPHEVYLCRQHRGAALLIAKKWVEAEVARRMFRKLDNDRVEQHASLPDDDPDADLRSELERLRWGREELDRDYYQEQRLDRESFAAQRTEIGERIQNLEDKLELSGDRRALTAHAAALETIEALWSEMTALERRAAFTLAVDRVLVKRAPYRGARPTSSRIQVHFLLP